PPDMAGEQVIERRDWAPPRQRARDLQPLRVLVEHRIDNVGECLVGVEETVTAGEQIAFEPALTLVLAEHLEHSSVRREPLVSGESLRLPLSVGRGKDRVEAIRDRFIGTEES